MTTEHCPLLTLTNWFFPATLDQNSSVCRPNVRIEFNFALWLLIVAQAIMTLQNHLSERNKKQQSVPLCPDGDCAKPQIHMKTEK